MPELRNGQVTLGRICHEFERCRVKRSKVGMSGASQLAISEGWICNLTYLTMYIFVAVPLPKIGVTEIAVDVVYDELERLPGVAVMYAGEACTKLAISFASLYFCLVTSKFSSITAP